MAKIDKKLLMKKKKKGLGTPPTLTDTIGNLESPEVAPAPKEMKPKTTKPVKKVEKVKTLKTAQLSTKHTPEFKQALKLLALKHNMDVGDLIKEAVELWEKNKAK